MGTIGKKRRRYIKKKPSAVELVRRICKATGIHCTRGARIFCYDQLESLTLWVENVNHKLAGSIEEGSDDDGTETCSG